MNILEKVIYAFNKMPNTKNVGPNGESTYDLVKELETQYPLAQMQAQMISELSYEEQVEIFKEFSDDEKTSRFTGAEYHNSAMEKAKQIFNQLPKTSY